MRATLLCIILIFSAQQHKPTRGEQTSQRRVGPCSLRPAATARAYTEPQQSLGKRRGLRRFDSTSAAARGGHRRGHLAWWWRSCSAISSSIECRSDSFTKPKCTSSWASASGRSPGSTGHVNCRFILSSMRSSSVICRSVALITASSRRFTEHIMVTTRRASTSTGSGDSDLTDDSVVTSGDAARVRAGANAVSG